MKKHGFRPLCFNRLVFCIPTILLVVASAAYAQSNQCLVLTCASDKVVAAGPWNFDPPSIVSTCCTNTSLTVLSTVTNTHPCSQSFTRTWRLSGCSNSVLCSQTVTVENPGLPNITSGAVSLTVTQNNQMLLNVSAVGCDLEYQWSFLDFVLEGQTNSTLLLAHAQEINAGDYFARVSNPNGAVTGLVASVSVTTVPDPIGLGWRNALNDPSANIFQIIREGNAYLDSNTNSSADDDDNDASEFIRFGNFWGGRTTVLGGFATAINAMDAYWKKKQSGCSCFFGANWTPLGPFSVKPLQDGGRLTCLFVDQLDQNDHDYNFILAGSDSGGLWKTTDGGAHWACVTDNSCLPGLGISSIAVDPTSSHNTIYIGTGVRGYGLGVLKSVDGGSTWHTTGLVFNPDLPNERQTVRKVLIHPNLPQVLYAVTDTTLYRSDNSGVTWAKVGQSLAGGRFFSDIQFYRSNPNIVFATGDALYKYDDGNGGSWTDLTPDLLTTIGASGTPERIAISTTAADPLRLYILVRVPDEEAYLVKHDPRPVAPVPWSLPLGFISPGVAKPTGECNFGFWYPAFVVSPANTAVLYTDGLELNKSVDLGLDFEPASDYFGVETHADVRAIWIASASGSGASDVVFIGSDGGISKTTDGTQTWKSLNGTGPSGICAQQFYGIAGYQGLPDFVTAGAQDAGEYDNYSGDWIQRTFSIGDGYRPAVDVFNPQKIIITCNSMAGSGGSLASGSWNGIQEPPGGRETDRPIVVHPSNVIYVGYDNVFYRKQDGSWQQISHFSGPEFRTHLKAIAVAPSDTNVVYAGFAYPTWGQNQITGQNCSGNPCPPSTKLFRTGDGGLNWVDVTTGLSPVVWAGITDIKVDPGNPDRIWVSFNMLWSDPNDQTHSADKGVNRVWQGVFNGTGMTWTDFSSGLPIFPVNRLVYQEGSFDALYAATDVGVFYREGSMTQWVCFNNQLPNVPVTDLDINYCNRTIKAGTYGRGIWQSPLATPGILGIPRVPTFVSSSDTWSTDRRLNTDLVVEAPNTLTIKGKVYVASDATITVEPGARLVLDGGTLTSDCPCLWQGVQVWGDVTASQLPLNNSPQGALIMKNNASIENAWEAVRLWNPGDYSSPGGIVQATDSSFKNNRRAAEFIAYENFVGSYSSPLPANRIRNNLSYFNHCQFEIDGPLKCGAGFECFVSMWKTRGVGFFGNTFINNAPASFPVGQRGNGIRSIDAAFNVTPLCTCVGCYPCPPANQIPNQFLNLFQGILSTTGADPSRRINIDTAKFVNNCKAVIIQGTERSSIYNSDFDIPGLTWQPTLGLLLDTCTGYEVTGNTFHAAANNQTYTTGALIKDSGTANNLVYQNTFNNLQYATFASGINAATGSGIGPFTGLQLRCNSYNDPLPSQLDIYIPAGASINLFQGWNNNNGTPIPAGNTFTHNCQAGTDTDISSASSLIYFYPASSPALAPLCYSTPLVTIAGIPTPLSCPGPNHGGNPGQLQALAGSALIQATNLMSSLSGNPYTYTPGFVSAEGQLHSQISDALLQRDTAQDELLRQAFDAPDTNGLSYLTQYLDDERALSVLGHDHVLNATISEIQVLRETGDLQTSAQLLNTLATETNLGPFIALQTTLNTLAASNTVPFLMTTGQLSVVQSVAASGSFGSVQAQGLLFLVSSQPPAVPIPLGFQIAVPNPVISNVAVSSNAFSFFFQSLDGAPYAVEYKNVMTDPNWAPLQSVVGTGAAIGVQDNILGHATRFYRVRLEAGPN